MSRVLSERERAVVAQKRAEWIDAFVEDDDMIKRLYEVGLIEGWRSVIKVEKKGQDDGTD